MAKTTISFSALKIFQECAYKYKLSYVDELKGFEGNEYTAFGRAIHEACELKIQNETLNEIQHFSDSFDRELKTLPEGLEKKQELIDAMYEQGKMLAPLVIPELRKQFGDFVFVSAEEELGSPLEVKSTLSFKGFIDLVIKTPDGKYHIIDYKTSSFGWLADKKADPMTTYQLTYYKHFFAKAHNIDPKMIETYFVILKRTAKKNNVEVFRVTSGPKKTTNALKVLNDSATMIDKGVFFKNRANCTYCQFYKKECK